MWHIFLIHTYDKGETETVAAGNDTKCKGDKIQSRMFIDSISAIHVFADMSKEHGDESGLSVSSNAILINQ